MIGCMMVELWVVFLVEIVLMVVELWLELFVG